MGGTVEAGAPEAARVETRTEVIVPAGNEFTQAVSRRWGTLYQHNALVRLIDDFWYERDRIASTVVSLAGELCVDAFGILLVPGILPKATVLTMGRIVGLANEGHTLYFATKHRNYALFNQTQTWVRNANGVISRQPGFLQERKEKHKRRNLPLQKRFVLWGIDFAKAYFTESTRMPAFVIMVTGAGVTDLFGHIYHLPMAVMLAGFWGPVILPGIPEARNAVRAILHRDKSIFSKPQMQTAQGELVGIEAVHAAHFGQRTGAVSPQREIRGKATTRRNRVTSREVFRRGGIHGGRQSKPLVTRQNVPVQRLSRRPAPHRSGLA